MLCLLIKLKFLHIIWLSSFDHPNMTSMENKDNLSSLLSLPSSSSLLSTKLTTTMPKFITFSSKMSTTTTTRKKFIFKSSFHLYHHQIFLFLLIQFLFIISSFAKRKFIACFLSLFLLFLVDFQENFQSEKKKKCNICL